MGPIQTMVPIGGFEVQDLPRHANEGKGGKALLIGHPSGVQYCFMFDAEQCVEVSEKLLGKAAGRIVVAAAGSVPV